jgi:hypothetical protein
LESARDGLDWLLWIHLKLLVARHRLVATRAEAGSAGLRSGIAELERNLASAGAPAVLRDSQAATLRLLRQRQENLEHCDASLTQVDSERRSRTEASLPGPLSKAAYGRKVPGSKPALDLSPPLLLHV